jgi:hypothetical protein
MLAANATALWEKRDMDDGKPKLLIDCVSRFTLEASPSKASLSMLAGQNAIAPVYLSVSAWKGRD